MKRLLLRRLVIANRRLSDFQTRFRGTYWIRSFLADNNCLGLKLVPAETSCGRLGRTVQLLLCESKSKQCVGVCQ